MYLVDLPTTRVLDQRNLQVTFRFYGEGGVLTRVGAALTDSLTLGVSYAGEGLIGQEGVRWGGRPGLTLRYRVKDETERIPVSFTLGYESQGYGPYYASGEEVFLDGVSYTVLEGYGFYRVSSQGFFVTAGKEIPLGIYALAGLNRSMEAYPGRSALAFFVGVEERFGSSFAGKLEYSDLFHGEIGYEEFLEDYTGEAPTFRRPGGELNLGVCWYPAPTVLVEFALRDLTKRYYPFSGNRVFRINYHGKF